MAAKKTELSRFGSVVRLFLSRSSTKSESVRSAETKSPQMTVETRDKFIVQ